MSSAETRARPLELESLPGLAWVGILAALVTAIVHLVLGVRMVPSGMGISFVLAGVGFLGAIGLVLFGIRRRAVYAVGIPFTLVQIVLWYVVNFANGPKAFPADVGTLGAIDKAAQVVLIAVLLVLFR